MKTIEVHVPWCELCVHSSYYRPARMNQSTQVVSIITPDSHSIIKQAGVTKKSNLNAVRPYPIRVYVSGCERGVHIRGYRPEWVNQSTILVSSIILDPHPIIKQAGMMGLATSNAARLRPIGYMYWGVNEVFTAEVTGQNE